MGLPHIPHANPPNIFWNSTYFGQLYHMSMFHSEAQLTCTKKLYLYDFGNGTSPKTTQPQPSLSRQKKQWWPWRLDLNIFKPLDAKRGGSKNPNRKGGRNVDFDHPNRCQIPKISISWDFGMLEKLQGKCLDMFAWIMIFFPYVLFLGRSFVNLSCGLMDRNRSLGPWGHEVELFFWLAWIKAYQKMMAKNMVILNIWFYMILCVFFWFFWSNVVYVVWFSGWSITSVLFLHVLIMCCFRKGPVLTGKRGRCEKTTNHIQHIPSFQFFQVCLGFVWTCLDLLSKLPVGIFTTNWQHLNTPFVKTPWVPSTAAASWHLDNQGGDLDVTFIGTTIFFWKFPYKRSAIIMNHRSFIDLHKKYWGKEQLTRSANVVRDFFTKQVQNDVAPEITLGNFEV